MKTALKNTALFILFFGFLYFMVHTAIYLNIHEYIINNLPALILFFLIGVAVGLVPLFFVAGERADESAMEFIITDLQEQLDVEMENYNNMRGANEALQERADLLEKTIDFKNEALAMSFTEIDRLRAIVNQKSNLSVDKDGRLAS